MISKAFPFRERWQPEGLTEEVVPTKWEMTNAIKQHFPFSTGG